MVIWFQKKYTKDLMQCRVVMQSFMSAIVIYLSYKRPISLDDNTPYDRQSWWHLETKVTNTRQQDIWHRQLPADSSVTSYFFRVSLRNTIY